MALNPFGVAGIPGGIGGSTLGLGIVISLHDMFSKQATRVSRQMNMLEAQSVGFAGAMERNARRMNTAIASLGVGIAGLAAISFPMRAAARFETAIKNVMVVMEDLEAFGGRSKLENIALDLSSIFPESATDMASSLATIIKAGIEDVGKAEALLRSSNMLAKATGGELARVTEGMTSIVHAYRIGLDVAYSPERAQEEFDKVGSMLFAAMKYGKFSDVTGIEDIEALSKQFGQIAPTASGLNIPIEEFLALWSAATLGGQNARRSATGIRQAFMDIQNRSRRPDSMPGFMAFMEGRENIYGGDLARYVQEEGFYSLLGHVREYANIKDPARLQTLMQTPNMRRRIDEVLHRLPEDMSIDEAMKTDENARVLIEEIANAGGLDISKLNEVFRSIWGITAVLPLVGVQFENIPKIMDKINAGATSNELLEAFGEIADTLEFQWKRMTSLFENISTLLGESIREEVKTTLKFFNDGLVLIQKFMEANRELVGALMRTLTAFFGFLSVFGALLGMKAAITWFNIELAKMTAQMSLLPFLVRIGLAPTLGNIMTLLLGLSAVMFAVRKAWEADFGGIRSTVEDFYERFVTISKAIKMLFRTLDEEGIAYITEAMYEDLQRLGVADFTRVLFGFLYRLRKAWRGFTEGFKTFYEGLYTAFRVLYKSTLKPILEYFGIATEFLEGLMQPTRENAEAWGVWGKRIGFAVAGLLTFFTILNSVGLVVKLSLVIANLSAAILRLGLVLLWNPAGAILLAIAGAAYYTYKAFDKLEPKLRDVFGDKMVDSLNTVFNIFRNWSYYMENMGFWGTMDYMGQAIGLSKIGERIENLIVLFRNFDHLVDVMGFKDALKFMFERGTGMDWHLFVIRMKTGLKKAWGHIKDYFKEEVARAWTELRDWGSRNFSWFDPLMENLGSLGKFGEAVWHQMTLIAQALVIPFLNNMPYLREVLKNIGDMVAEFFNMLGTWFGSNADGNVDVWKTFWNAVQDTLDLALASILVGLDVFAITLESLFLLGQGKPIEAWDNFLTKMGELLGVHLPEIKNRFISLRDDLMSIFDGLGQLMADVFLSSWHYTQANAWENMSKLVPERLHGKLGIHDYSGMSYWEWMSGGEYGSGEEWLRGQQLDRDASRQSARTVATNATGIIPPVQAPNTTPVVPAGRDQLIEYIDAGLAAARIDDGRVSDQEVQDLITLLQQLVAQDQTITVNVDGNNLMRIVQSRLERTAQTGGAY